MLNFCSGQTVRYNNSDKNVFSTEIFSDSENLDEIFPYDVASAGGLQCDKNARFHASRNRKTVGGI